MSLTELTNQLSKTFDECLESILSEPQQPKEEGNEGLDTRIATLKSCFLDIESQLRDIRLKALGSKELSVQESNKLLKRDIDIKKSAIEKYVTKIETWQKELPVLKENSKKAVALRTDGNDFDSDIVIPSPVVEPMAEDLQQATGQQVDNTNIEDEDDEDDDVEFEEV